MNPWPDLRPVLQGIPWVVVGAVAARAYMPERATKDLDILVRRGDGDKVRERLEAAGYRFITHLAVPGFLVHSPESSLGNKGKGVGDGRGLGRQVKG